MNVNETVKENEVESNYPSFDNLEGQLLLLNQLSQKYGKEKASKILDCLQGVTLALNCFYPDVRSAALDVVSEIHRWNKKKTAVR